MGSCGDKKAYWGYKSLGRATAERFTLEILRCGPANTRYRSARLPPIWGALPYHSLGRGCPCTAALGVDIPGADDGMQICSGDGNDVNDACADLLGWCGWCGSS